MIREEWEVDGTGSTYTVMKLWYPNGLYPRAYLVAVTFKHSSNRMHLTESLFFPSTAGCFGLQSPACVEPRRRCWISWSFGYRWLWVAPCVRTSGPQLEQEGLWTPEPSLQPVGTLHVQSITVRNPVYSWYVLMCLCKYMLCVCRCLWWREEGSRLPVLTLQAAVRHGRWKLNSDPLQKQKYF